MLPETITPGLNLRNNAFIHSLLSIAKTHQTHILFGTPDISGRPDYDLKRWAKEETLEETLQIEFEKIRVSASLNVNFALN